MRIRQQDIDILLVKELTGDISDTEQQQLGDWKKQSEQNKQEHEAFQLVWNKSEGLQSFVEEDAAVAWKSCKARMNFSEATSSNRLNWVRKLAAVMIPAILVMSSFFIYQNVPGFGRLSAFSTNEQVDSIKLIDNSLVTIAKGSRIVYVKGFDEAERRIKLKGQAYFKVARNETKPFVVKVGNAEVKVLGTEFNLSENDDCVDLNVTHGKVKITCGNESEIVSIGEKATVVDGLIKKDSIENLNFLSWKTGVLHYENANFSTVLNSIRDHFTEVNSVVMNGTLPSEKITTRFKQPLLDEVIEELAIHFKKKIDFNDGKLIISD